MFHFQSQIIFPHLRIKRINWKNFNFFSTFIYCLSKCNIFTIYIYFAWNYLGNFIQKFRTNNVISKSSCWIKRYVKNIILFSIL